MRFRASLCVILALAAVSCTGALAGATIGDTHPTMAPPMRAASVFVYDEYGRPIPTAVCGLDGATDQVVPANSDGYVLFPYVPMSLRATQISCTAPNFEPFSEHRDLTSSADEWIAPNVTMTTTLPPAPTRDEAINLCLSFQGLTVHTQQFGDEPYFESSLAWHDVPEDRQAIYAAKHAAKNAFCPGGDTHALIHVPFGPPLYDEGGQFYSPDKFGPRDWTTGNTRMDPKFIALVTEVRQAGFIPLITACGDGDKPENYACAMAETPLILDALEHGGPRDLRQDVILMPCYDGCFYGWEPAREKIPAWARLVRASCPNCILAFEHGTGHIPLGEGDSDWVRGGAMQLYDLLLSEFIDDQFDDTVWQIAARTLGPAYRRPSNQPAADDPGAPFCATCGQFYLREGTPRGPFKACAFEFGLYDFVRWHYDSAHVEKQRQYFVNVGYTCGG